VDVNEITEQIIGAAMEVHRALGPGLLEHEAQLLTHLRIGCWKVGPLINFNVPVLKNGIRRRML
jgi:hypothetical protein